METETTIINTGIMSRVTMSALALCLISAGKIISEEMNITPVVSLICYICAGLCGIAIVCSWIYYHTSLGDKIFKWQMKRWKNKDEKNVRN